MLGAHRTNAKIANIGPLAILLAVLMHAPCSSAEVTVVGSPWPNRPAPKFDASRIAVASTAAVPTAATATPKYGAQVGLNLPSDDTVEDTPPPELADPSVLANDVRTDHVRTDNLSAEQDMRHWFTLACAPLEACWYTKFDYFSWQERGDNGAELLNEHGTLYTLGYQRSVNARRLRLELFTGNMEFGGAIQKGPPFESTTNYLGGRAEFELLWNIQPERWPEFDVFAGIGTRFWIRDLKDGPILDTHLYHPGYQETWATLYPYIGLEKRWGHRCDEFFVRGRLGLTTFTYDNRSEPLPMPGDLLSPMPPLFPNPGLTGSIECGLRYENFFFSAVFEGMSWARSDLVDGWYQPQSTMLTTGLKLGLVF